MGDVENDDLRPGFQPLRHFGEGERVILGNWFRRFDRCLLGTQEFRLGSSCHAHLGALQG
jgi:hypothetical protein